MSTNKFKELLFKELDKLSSQFKDVYFHYGVESYDDGHLISVSDEHLLDNPIFIESQVNIISKFIDVDVLESINFFYSGDPDYDDFVGEELFYKASVMENLGLFHDFFKQHSFGTIKPFPPYDIYKEIFGSFQTPLSDLFSSFETNLSLNFSEKSEFYSSFWTEKNKPVLKLNIEEEPEIESTYFLAA